MLSLRNIASHVFCALNPQAKKIGQAEAALLDAYDQFLLSEIRKLYFLASNSNSLNFENGLYIPVLRPYFKKDGPDHGALKREMTLRPEGFLAQALGGLEFDMQKYPLTKTGERDPVTQGHFYNKRGTYNYYRCALVKLLKRTDISPEEIRKQQELIHN